MGDKWKDLVVEDVRSILNGRVSRYQLLLLDCVTPLLHKELLDATRQHEEMLQQPDPITPEQKRAALRQLGHLDSIDAQVSVHWQYLHRDPVSRASLLANIIGYQWFLAKWVLLDYAGHPQRKADLDPWVSNRVEELDLHHKAGVERENDRDFKMYQQTITTPIKELMLDQEHVERRIRLAAAEPYPTGEIYRLIDECDWSTLAMMLFRDRELAVTLYSQKPLDAGSYDDKIAKIVLREMDEIRDRYFTELSGPSTYTTSKHAQERSARKEAGLPLDPEPRRRSEGDWVSAAAKGVFNKVVSSLGLGAGARPGSSVYPRPSGESSRPSMDSTTHLLSSKDQRD